MKYLSTILAIASTTFLTVHAEAFGNNGGYAKQACAGFPMNGQVVCLSDLTFAKCEEASLGIEIRVDPGHHCEQGIVGQKVDAILPGDSTKSSYFWLHAYGATAAPTATPTTLSTTTAATSAAASS
ncbi:hypothetical protein PMZ80_000775 [Knufia obscura]|uniref:Uncharacterized protein n=1 Tax=Knufia obscura TaxID=1635080 RepID=A0ABR0S175_9EURO|nr:hypothetical protein PMZ80_000775 [Knufia obscura]